MIDSKNFHSTDEEAFFKMLSQSLKDEIIAEVNGKILVDCKFFSSCFTSKACLFLSKYMVEKFMAPEEMLF